MGVKLVASSGGSVELVPTNTASDFTVTVPAATTTMVGTDATQTLTNKTLTTPNINSAQVATVSGTAPLYMCRAWVRFIGGASVATISGSANVTSITRNSTGLYTINLTTAMPDNTGAIVGSIGINGNNGPLLNTLYANSTSSTISIGLTNVSLTLGDGYTCSIALIR